MIKHTIPATNRMTNGEATIELVTDPINDHVELRISGGAKALAQLTGRDGGIALNIDNESMAAFARSALASVPHLQRRRS